MWAVDALGATRGPDLLLSSGSHLCYVPNDPHGVRAAWTRLLASV